MGATLDRHYAALERRYEVQEAPDLGALVVPNGNASRPFHRWFHLKEGYSCDLLTYVLRETHLAQRRNLKILDPFAGGGTTIVSAADWAGAAEHRKVTAVGIERNPFLAFLSRVKAEAIAKGDVAIGSAPKITGPAQPIPALSTFGKSDFFDHVHLQELLKLRRAILAEPDGLARRLRLLALTTCVEPVSRLRRDGRTMRRAGEKPKVSPRAELQRRLKQIQHDLQAITRPIDVELTIHDGDSRQASEHLHRDFKAHLVVCSPPYPNNIDYTEVYKLEAWFMGAYETLEDFRLQRHRTLRSHPSVKFVDPPTVTDKELRRDLRKLCTPLLRALPRDRYRLARKRLIHGYVEDMALTLQACHTHTASGGWMSVIVGNSLHGSSDRSLLLAADLLIARAGELVGWDVVGIDVGRRPARRSAEEPRLRESMVLLRRPRC